ncbi:hypothetical protein ITP53_13900 [Nonomuraea sp. K274]|uniref:Serine/threonine protein kinase n=1 Tax=Nonomuraea cypriaca TaxID=1187855 RepID=A0A931F053_9ACTN|nr:hypothetical protein [Nonomuraea cypriaca]MBF8186816.1 hypothetical protein [Nonomuraea cypriaca]
MAGPFRDEALYLLALGSATTMARLHMAGIAGLRLNPGNVMIGPRGRAFFAPGPRDSEFPSNDVRDWAGVIVFAATGCQVDEEPDFDRLPPALRVVVDECRRSDPAARPTSVDLVRILLGHSTAATAATVDDLLCEAEHRTSPDEPAPYEEALVSMPVWRKPAPYEEGLVSAPVWREPAPYAETLVSTPVWRKPAYLGGVAIGVLVVAVAAGGITMVSAQAARPDTGGVLEAVGRRTAAFHQEGESPKTGERFAADGRLSFDGNAATSYEMKIVCGNAPDPVDVSLAGNDGVADGVPFAADRPDIQACAQYHAPSVRRFSSPYTIKALLDAAGTGVRASGDGRTLTGTALAHRIRGAESADGGTAAEGPIRFSLLLDDAGLPVRLRLDMTSRAHGPMVADTVYRDWRAPAAGEVPNG